MEKAGVSLSNTDKVMFEEPTIRKKDLIDYYDMVKDVMLPHIRKRPMTLHRFPDGISKEGFYQQEAGDHFPEFIETITLDKEQGGKTTHVLCNDRKSLIYLANQATITPHVWLSRKDHPDKPDKLIIDLDPEKEDVAALVKTAKKVRDILEEDGLCPFVMTTGSKGVHIAVPLEPNFNFEAVRDYAGKVAKAVNKALPKTTTLERRKEKREGRIYLDYSRNAIGQTSVAPYALRAKKNAPVALPVTWEELDNEDFSPQMATFSTLFKRLETKKDPWKSFEKHRRKLPKRQ